ncbi:MAG: hypothetical protein HXY40_12535 [Chloroflexi bacterium]|nr:hypothetical protein [Chloroflexota bacterium]
MAEHCTIQYDHYYDEFGSQFVLVAVYDDGRAIDELWSNSASLDDEQEVQRFGSAQLQKALTQMQRDGWQIEASEEQRSLETVPASEHVVYRLFKKL